MDSSESVGVLCRKKPVAQSCSTGCQDSSDLTLKICSVSWWLLTSSRGFLPPGYSTLHLFLVIFCMKFIIISFLWPIELPLNSSLVAFTHPLHTPEFWTIRTSTRVHSILLSGLLAKILNSIGPSTDR